MNQPIKTNPVRRSSERLPFKRKIQALLLNIRTLQGEPRYIALGMAIGVFVGVTPTIPFHTVIALALAFIFKSSKPAAAIGVWVSNPVTIPFFYFGSYRLGTALFNISMSFNLKYESVTELFKLGTTVTIAMIVGGILLGIPLSIAAYFVTLKVAKTVRRKRTEH